jgi:hypothetical protein
MVLGHNLGLPTGSQCLYRAYERTLTNSAAFLVHTCVQINNNVDGSHENLRCDEHNDNPFQIFACMNNLAQVGCERLKKRTMSMAQLVLQNCQQICNHSNSLLQKCDSLIHL